ncbi:MAG TPA: cytochrome P450 [Kofleriaceae bacterium]|jgi:pentalenene oxygenase|nr:cytochrome P450 [Kofleriaceae bacterium]
MLLAHREDDSALTPQEVHDQVLTLFLAGTETTAAVIAWSLYLLGAHPAMMERLRAEVDTVVAGQAVRWEHLTKLLETQRVITEDPPAWLFTRVTTEDSALGAHHLAKGTGIGCSPYLLHHDPDLFEAPDRFDPDRWLPERARTVPKEAFIPFGGGARKCIGDAFGLAEATLVLAAITARWDLHPTLDRPVRPVPRRAALTPGALPMRVRSRAHGAS